MPLKIVTTADGSNTAFSEQYGQTFHSVNGAVTESRHVFLEATGVRQRLESGLPTRVLEIGFGLGLNCLLTLDNAISSQTTLEYHSIESNPAPPPLTSLNYVDQLLHKSLPDSLTAAFSQDGANTPVSKRHYSAKTAFNSNSQVTLHHMDAALNDLPQGPFDAIYLDPFCPQSNPECWTPDFLQKLYQRLHKTGVLTTYSAKGSVRRAMLHAGFFVKKMAGPPGKREMLAASPSEFPPPGN